LSNYSIFALAENLLTVSGGGQLDGVTQGDGSHLVGRTITLNSNSWSEVQIADDDTDFRDNDSSQKLDGAQTFNGTTYANGTVVEAEYGLTLSDGTNTWQVVGFNMRDSPTSYATIEGLAFIGGPGGFPPVGVPLTVTSAQEGPNFQVGAYATPVCYDAETLIDTPGGRHRIGDLSPGDLVNTLDHGPQQIRWIGTRPVIAAGRFAPVQIDAGTMGAIAPLRVSQQHRILIRSPGADLLFGTPEVFAPAAHLLDEPGIRLLTGGSVVYMHLLLDRHEVIFANGIASESLYMSDAQTDRTDTGVSFFPELQSLARAPQSLARQCLRRHETRLLRAAMGTVAQPLRRAG
jgi:hypothetical protein